MIAVLFPRFDHPAIEERYASWQSQMLLRREPDIEFAFYDPEEPAAAASSLVESDHALVITDPLLIPPQRLAAQLRESLVHTPEAVAALPVSNDSAHAAQVRSPLSPYVTLREMQETMAAMQAGSADLQRVQWDDSDPGAYLMRSSLLDTIEAPPRRALAGREVVLSGNNYIHRWTSMRAQQRDDLLAAVSTTAKSILEFRCGEAPLGAALKARQRCRVVGIEEDPRAAAVARKRIDDVYCGDAREIIAIIDEKFDWIIGADIVQHLEEPWSFLSDLRHVAKPDGRLLVTLPNIANGAVVADLLHGRFDYAYMGLTSVGHLRFFTRRTIEEMLTMAGWQIETITPLLSAATPVSDALLARLRDARIFVSEEDIAPFAYYVVARNGTHA